MARQLILTTLDWIFEAGAVDEADLASVRSQIDKLRRRSTAVVGFSRRSRAELSSLLNKIGPLDGIVVENGSAIAVPASGSLLETPPGELDGDCYIFDLGCPYVQARAGLRVLANLVSHPLKGFGDFTVQQLERSLQVSESAAHQAKAKEYSEPFMIPKAVEAQQLQKTASGMGFKVVWPREQADERSGRFALLLGAGASVKAAAGEVIKAATSDESIDVLTVSNQTDDLMNWRQAAEEQKVRLSEALIIGGLEAIASAAQGLPMSVKSYDGPFLDAWITAAQDWLAGFE